MNAKRRHGRTNEGVGVREGGARATAPLGTQTKRLWKERLLDGIQCRLVHKMKREVARAVAERGRAPLGAQVKRLGEGQGVNARRERLADFENG